MFYEFLNQRHGFTAMHSNIYCVSAVIYGVRIQVIICDLFSHSQMTSRVCLEKRVKKSTGITFSADEERKDSVNI